jgi:hypothetical protein
MLWTWKTFDVEPLHVLYSFVGRRDQCLKNSRRFLGNKDPEKDLQRWKKNWCNPGKYYCKCRGPRDAVYSSFCEDCFQARLWDHEENDIDAECHPQLVFSRKKIAFLLGRESNREHHRKALESTSTLERLYVTISRIHLNTLYPRPSEKGSEFQDGHHCRKTKTP